MPTVDIDVSGPMFNGMAASTIAAACRAAERDVAAQGYSLVATRLNQKIKQPTPYYETQITVQRLGQFTVIHDRDVIYGTWLEGTSQRNADTSFKGYHAFGRARTQLNQEAPMLVSHAIAPYIAGIS